MLREARLGGAANARMSRDNAPPGRRRKGPGARVSQCARRETAPARMKHMRAARVCALTV